jgi:hypothetical protein
LMLFRTAGRLRAGAVMVSPGGEYRKGILFQARAPLCR